MTIARLAYDPGSLAEALGVKKSTVYKLIREGTLRSFKIGKRGVRVSVEEAQRWVRERENEQNGIAAAIAPSAGAKAGRLPTSAIKALASAKG